MFFLHHPRPLIDGRAVAVQVVQQKIGREPVQHVLVVPVIDGAKVQQPLPDALEG